MTTARSSRPDDSAPPLARLVELALVVPIEVGGRLIEAVPAVIDKVPTAADRVRRELVLARFLGKMVVDQGVREVQSRLQRDDPAVADVEPASAAAAVADEPPTTALASPDDPDVPDVAALALVDYDHLSSAQIVGKLDGLDAAERGEIERYEMARRHRRTVLGKLEQLRAADT
jgi:hypothetical protein